MGSIANVFFKAELDDGKLQVDAKRAGDKAGGSIGKSLTESIKKSWNTKELGKGLVQGLGLAGGLGAANLLSNGLGVLSGAISGAIDDASNLNETVSKGKVIFGANADEMEAWAGTASKSFGQSKRAALDTASTFAGLFSTVGLTLDDATDKARDLTELGSDLASFFNTDVAEATQALRSGLSGESEPLRRFNIFLSETAVQAKAVELGMKKTNGQFTEGQKVTARYAIIMDQTGAAQGDFARTSDGLANSTRTLEAAWEDASAQAGQVLLPIVTQFVQFLANDGIPTVLAFADAVGQIEGPKTGTDPFGDFIKSIRPDELGANIHDILWPVDITNAGLTQNIGETAKHVEAVVGEKFGPAFTGAWKKVDTQPAALAVTQAFGSDLAAKSGTFKKYADNLAATVTKALADGIYSRRDTAEQGWQALLDGLENQMTPGREKGRLLGYLVSDELRKGLESKDPALRAQAEATAQLWIDQLHELIPAGSKIGKDGMEMLKKGMKSKNPTIRAAATEIYNSVKNPIKPVVTNALTWGANAGKNFAKGLRRQVPIVEGAAIALAGAAGRYIKILSPAEAGPLAEGGGSERWGENLGYGMASGLLGTVTMMTHAADKFAAAAVPDLGLGSRVPMTTGVGARVGQVGAAAAPASVTNNYYNTANVEGLIQAKSPLDIARALGRVARNGGMAPLAQPGGAS